MESPRLVSIGAAGSAAVITAVLGAVFALSAAAAAGDTQVFIAAVVASLLDR